MGLMAAYHNGLNQKPKASGLTFDTLLKKNDLKTKVEDEVKSIIEDNTKTDNVDLTNGMSEEEAIDKYIAGLSDGEKNNLIKNLLGSAVDSVVNFFTGDEVEETPTVDPKTVEDTAKDTTMIGENEVPTEDAEVDPTTAKVMEYAELDEQALYSKLSAINSQLAGLEGSLDTITQMFEAGEMSIVDYKKACKSIGEQEKNYEEEKSIIEAAKTYKQEAKIIEKMTPEQQAKLETINNEMIEISEKLAELLEKQLDNAQKGVEVDETLQAEIEDLYGQLAPLQEQRQALFDNAGKVDETATAPEAEEVPDVEKMLNDIEDIKNNIGNFVVDNNTFKTDDKSSDDSAKTLADKLREEATKDFIFGTTTTTKSDEKEIKPTSNFFTKVADGVKSDDLDGILDAMDRKNMSETFTNAKKVGDNAGVDFTRRQFLRAMDERLI